MEGVGLEWAAASLIHPEENQSGDAYVVKALNGDELVAVIDAVGHGKDAAHAAHVAVDALQKCGVATLDSLFRRCHADLRRTRGAAISMARFDGHRGTMQWLGVGNVAGVLARADVS